jgi:hypothetical protein
VIEAFNCGTWEKKEKFLATLKPVVDKNSIKIIFNPLPHGVLASFYLTAGGLLRPPKEDDISREKTILMT